MDHPLALTNALLRVALTCIPWALLNTDKTDRCERQSKSVFDCVWPHDYFFAVVNEYLALLRLVPKRLPAPYWTDASTGPDCFDVQNVQPANAVRVYRTHRDHVLIQVMRDSQFLLFVFCL